MHEVLLGVQCCTVLHCAAHYCTVHCGFRSVVALQSFKLKLCSFKYTVQCTLLYSASQCCTLLYRLHCSAALSFTVLYSSSSEVLARHWHMEACRHCTGTCRQAVDLSPFTLVASFKMKLQNLALFILSPAREG